MKVTIKGIVKENREDLLVDKIVKSLLDDTEYRLYHRFMGEIVCELIFPMFNGPKVYDKVEIKDFKNTFNNYTDNDTVIQFSTSLGWNKYMDSNYGITNMFTLSRIGVTYYNTLFERILNDFENFHYTPDYGPVNESVENKEDLLVDKISQFMLDDTEYYFHRDRVVIVYPSEGFNSYTIDKVLPLLLRRGYDLNFVNYVFNTYGIKDWNLITNISQRYYSLLYDKVKEMLGSTNNPMNESVDRKEDTLNRIVDFMISDTKWDVFMEYQEVEDDEDWSYVKVTMYWPGGDSEEYHLKDFEVVWEKFIMGDIDRKYLEQHFGITEEWIKQELYNRYINKLRPIIYEEMKNYTE